MRSSEELLQKIMEEPSRQTPRWVALWKNKLVLAVFIIAVLLGGMAFSVILLVIHQSDFQMLSHLSHSPLEMFLGLLPLVWLVFLIAFLLISMYSILYSRRGYKFTVVRLFLNSAFLSVLIGTLFFIAGGAEQLEHAFAVNVNTYQSIQERKAQLWSQPEHGYLAGHILEVAPETILLRDLNDMEWNITISDDAFIAGRVQLDIGEMIKLLGEKTGESQFRAAEIRPWGGRHSPFGQENGGE